MTTTETQPQPQRTERAGDDGVILELKDVETFYVSIQALKGRRTRR